MLIKSIKLNNYRNYSNYYLDLDPNLNLIIGKNGIGKTNLLESIIVVSNTKSFRTQNDRDLIKKNKEYLKIEIKSDKDIYKVVINQKSKSLYINNNLIHKTSDFIGNINAVLFKPSDLEIFTDSPNIRRRLIDIEISKVNKKYLKDLSDYNYLLKDKNKLLKELEIDYTLLNVINETMVNLIKNIIIERKLFFEEINKYINSYYKYISNSNANIKILYKKCSELDDIKKNLEDSKQKDNYYHYATFGIHKEDYEFIFEGYELNSIASQGQKRMVLIAFKFALIQYIKKMTNNIPILLLDDILSELDDDNKQRLLNTIPKDTQVIITNTDTNNLTIKDKYKLIEIKEEENV